MDFTLSGIGNDMFHYNNLYESFHKNEIETFICRLSHMAASNVKSFDGCAYTQWILRHFLAAKMILAATVMLTSEEYCKNKNLQIVEPYLEYYAILSCARAVVFTNPNMGWSDDLLALSHKKTINVVGDTIKKLNKEKGGEFVNFMEMAKECRELYSYRFPANGIIDSGPSFEETVSWCKLLSEIAQLQSAVTARAIEKYTPSNLNYAGDVLDKGFMYGEKKLSFIDSSDWVRIGYIRKHKLAPMSLINTMTEGMVDDFFGAWAPKDGNVSNVYDPDKEWRIIFPVP